MSQILVYNSFDSMPCSEQFTFTELFPNQNGEFDDVEYFFTCLYDFEGMYNFVIKNGGNPETDMVTIWDETVCPQTPVFIYAIIKNKENKNETT